MILGIDEVGRGAWAGPLVVGAVVLGGAEIDGLTDSKKISAKRRKELSVQINNKAMAVGLGWVEASEIDRIGLAESLRLATFRAVEQIKVPYDEIIIDGTVNFLKGTDKDSMVKTMVKADLLIPSVSAASIVAKVARDQYMTNLDQQHEGYHFSKHVGYGTEQHKDAIERIGVLSLHRQSFKPIAEITAKSIGSSAEDLVSRYLLKNGHQILDRNWKNRYCEIDIVSSKNNRIFFTEVKYRKNDIHGDGLEYIGTKKLSQMRFAAEMYMSKAGDCDYSLAVASVSSKPMELDSWFELQ